MKDRQKTQASTSQSKSKTIKEEKLPPSRHQKAYSTYLPPSGDTSVKILRPELMSGALKLSQNPKAKIFDRNFQD